VLNPLKIGVFEEHAHSRSKLELYFFVIKQEGTLVKMMFVTSLQIKVDLIALPRIKAAM